MVTQQQIARKLGVSRQLVGFALGGYPQVSGTSRQRILAAAQKMGYRPNPHARALRHQRTGIIALFIPDQISTHNSRVARELNRLVRRERQELIISEMDSTEARQTLSHVPVDGVIAVDIPCRATMHRQILAARSIPLVTMGVSSAGETDSVRVDLKAGAGQVMDHLLGAGYRRIAHATFIKEKHARAEDQPEAGRRQGYEEAMRAAGLKTEFIYYPLSKQLRPVTRQLIQDYIRERGHPEALFCHSDDAALGVYRGLCDMKLRVPQDVALAGCDGIEDTEYLECPLTTLAQPVEEMCAAAWKFLTNRLNHPNMEKQSLVLQPRLEIRQSSLRNGGGP